jgi:hypothetical protein
LQTSVDEDALQAQSPPALAVFVEKADGKANFLKIGGRCAAAHDAS